VHLRVAQRLLYERRTALCEGCRQGGKLRPRQRYVEVEGAVGTHHQVGELEDALHDTGKLIPHLLRGLAKSLQGVTVCLRVDPVLRPKPDNRVSNEAVNKTAAPKTEAAAAGSPLTGAPAYLGDGDLTGPTADVNHHDRRALLGLH